MKHAKIFTAMILFAALLFLGCSAEMPAETSPVTEEVTTTAEITTTAEVTAAVTAKETGRDYIVPEESARVLEVTAERLVDLDAIREKYGYHIDYDLSSDEDYNSMVEMMLENCGEDELEELKDRNFFYEDFIGDAIYVGSENTDWIVELSYGIQGGQLASYEKFLFLKDGVITYETEIIQMHICSGIKVYGDTLFASTTVNGIFQLDLITGKHSFIPSDIWSITADISDDYILFGNGALNVYDRHTGEVFIPEPAIVWDGLDSGVKPELDGDSFIYSVKENGEETLYRYDIGERRGEVLSELCSLRQYRVDGKKYTAVAIRPENEKYKALGVAVTRTTDGVSKTFDINGFPEKYDDPTMNGKCFYEYGTVFIGDMMIPYITGLNTMIAIDFDTGEFLPVKCVNLKSFYTYWKTQRGDELYGMYWDENDEIQAGVLRFNVR